MESSLLRIKCAQVGRTIFSFACISRKLASIQFFDGSSLQMNKLDAKLSRTRTRTARKVSLPTQVERTNTTLCEAGLIEHSARQFTAKRNGWEQRLLRQERAEEAQGTSPHCPHVTAPPRCRRALCWACAAPGRLPNPPARPASSFRPPTHHSHAPSSCAVTKGAGGCERSPSRPSSRVAAAAAHRRAGPRRTRPHPPQGRSTRPRPFRRARLGPPLPTAGAPDGSRLPGAEAPPTRPAPRHEARRPRAACRQHRPRRQPPPARGQLRPGPRTPRRGKWTRGGGTGEGRAGGKRRRARVGAGEKHGSAAAAAPSAPLTAAPAHPRSLPTARPAATHRRQAAGS